jgi:hypothetical protein
MAGWLGIRRLGISYLDLMASINYKRVPALSVDDAWVTVLHASTRRGAWAKKKKACGWANKRSC